MSPTFLVDKNFTSDQSSIFLFYICSLNRLVLKVLFSSAIKNLGVNSLMSIASDFSLCPLTLLEQRVRSHHLSSASFTQFLQPFTVRTFSPKHGVRVFFCLRFRRFPWWWPTPSLTRTPWLAASDKSSCSLAAQGCNARGWNKDWKWRLFQSWCGQCFNSQTHSIISVVIASGTDFRWDRNRSRNRNRIGCWNQS